MSKAVRDSSTPPPVCVEASESKQTPKPKKKAWAKPTISRIDNGVVVTESGPNVGPVMNESFLYTPSSS